jgi:N-acetyl-1-D-myo-inositol-2-amino-2-deoxy-alpha-D-glucopyranoside deacetylase
MRVLALFPHPDDEAYAAGGLLAHCAAAGAAVRLVCATRGERGSDRSGGVAPGPALAALRTRELEQSCAALGIGRPRFLDLPDGALGAHHAAGAALVAAQLRDHRPHLVVTLGPDGAYGHLDHTAFTAMVGDAMRAAAAPPSRLLHALFPRALFAPLWRALSRRRPPPVAPIDPATLGVEATAADLRLDTGAHRARKLAAIAAHRSQLAGGDPFSFLLPGLIEPLLDEEWYAVAHGPALPAGAADPFAGL